MRTRKWLALAAIGLALLSTPAMAQIPIPDYDVATSCERLSPYNTTVRDMCLMAEGGSYKNIGYLWPLISSKDKQACIDSSQDLAQPSYTPLLDCVITKRTPSIVKPETSRYDALSSWQNASKSLSTR
jgi:hypothetical protein